MTDDDGWWRMELWGGGVTGAGRWQRIYSTAERLNHLCFVFLRFLNNSSFWRKHKRVSPVISSYLDDVLPPLRLIQKSEIICVTGPHTHTHRCALHCSIPVKNVIYSYLFITEKATLRCPVKVEGIPPPFTHTHSRTGQNKRFRVVNRVEAAECEERLSVCVCVCV